MPLTAESHVDRSISGKGGQVRDWLHVEDHAHALYQVVIEGEVGQTYYIGGHNEKTNLEVVKTICTILDETQKLCSRIRQSRKRIEKK